MSRLTPLSEKHAAAAATKKNTPLRAFMTVLAD
jgi:hypothetical protein